MSKSSKSERKKNKGTKKICTIFLQILCTCFFLISARLYDISVCFTFFLVRIYIMNCAMQSVNMKMPR